MFDFLRKKTPKREVSTEEIEDRTIKAKITRERNRQLQILHEEYKRLNDEAELMQMRQQIDDLKSELYDEEQDEEIDTPTNPEEMLLGLFMQYIHKGKGQSPQTPQNLTAAADFSQQQQNQNIHPLARQLIDSGAITTGQYEYFIKLPKKQKEKILKSYFPSIDDNQREEILKIEN